MIHAHTREQIKVAVGELLLGVINRYDPQSSDYVLADKKLIGEGRLNPFHQAMLTPNSIRLSRFERSFSTTLGSMFEVTAQLIGQQRFAESLRAHDFKGNISNAAQAGIDGIVDSIRAENFSGRYRDYVDTIVNSFHGDQIPVTVRADLYLRDPEGNELFFEMKAPKPNKDQCLSVTRKFLRFHAMRRSGPPKVRTFYAMSYNPYGTRDRYRWHIARNYLDINQQVLLGDEFWDLIGGSGTYEEVLDLFGEIGRDHDEALLQILD